MKIYSSRIWSVLGAALLVAVACGPQSPTGPGADAATAAPATAAPATAAPATAIDKAATLRVAHVSRPSTWDPILAQSLGASAFLTMVYDRLIYLKEDMTLAPGLAISWQASADGKSLDLELRRNVKFWDGTTFNAKAVQANLQRAKTDPASTAKSVLTGLDSITPIEDYKVRLTFSTGASTFPYLIAISNHFGYMANPAAFANADGLKATPAGSGPYKLARVGEDRAVYERWDAHWDPDAAKVATLELIAIADDNARLAALRTGQVDAILTRLAQFKEAKAVADSGAFVQTSFPSQVYGLFVNTKRPGFEKADVRRAISLGIDRKTISESLLSGQCKPTTQPYPSGFTGHDPSVSDSGVYDPNKAKQLLASAGATGLTLSLMQHSIEPNDSIAVAIAGQLNEIGVKVSIGGRYTTANWQATWSGGAQHDAMVLSASGGPDPSTLIANYVLNASFSPGPVPQSVVSAATQARDLPPGNERTAAYQKLSRSLAEEPLHIWLCEAPNQYLSKTNVLNMDKMALAKLGGVIDARPLAVAKR